MCKHNIRTYTRCGHTVEYIKEACSLWPIVCSGEGSDVVAKRETIDGTCAECSTRNRARGGRRSKGNKE